MKLPKVATAIATITTVGVVLFIFALMNRSVPAESKDILLVVGGGLLGAFQNIVSFYFGSSEKDQS